MALSGALHARRHRRVTPGEATHWTGPAMAKAVGISVSSAQRI
jgi:hypothetical protein